MNESILTVEKLIAGGDGLVYAPTSSGKTEAFRLRHVVPGDKLRLKNISKRHGVMRAEIAKLELASEFRAHPTCPVAEQCGGCALQYLHQAKHAETKSAWVKHAFKPVWQANVKWMPIESMGVLDDQHLRRRLRWHLERRDHHVVLGFRGYQSHQVVHTEHCMVIDSKLNDLRQALEKWFDLWDVKHLPQAIYALTLDDGIHIVLEFEGKAKLERMTEFSYLDLADNHLALQLWYRDQTGVRALQRPVHKLHDRLPTAAGDIMIHIGPEDFVQGQSWGNHAMIEQIRMWSGDASRIVDLFSGAGNLSLPLAASGKQVIGAEVNIASVRAANNNAKRLKLDAHYQQADLFAKFDMTDFVGAQVLLIDPPRKGAQNICQMMNHLLPQKVIWVHCDVDSAGRDARLMQQQGYRLVALRALDLFPYSGHVESLSLWQR